MKKLLLLALSAIMLFSCSSSYDSKVASAVKEIYGPVYPSLKKENGTSFFLNYSDKDIVKQKEELERLVWRIDKIVGKINSGEQTLPLYNIGLTMKYEWETTDVIITVTSNFYFSAIEKLKAGESCDGTSIDIIVINK